MGGVGKRRGSVRVLKGVTFHFLLGGKGGGGWGGD